MIRINCILKRKKFISGVYYVYVARVDIKANKRIKTKFNEIPFGKGKVNVLKRGFEDYLFLQQVMLIGIGYYLVTPFKMELDFGQERIVSLKN